MQKPDASVSPSPVPITGAISSMRSRNARGTACPPYTAALSDERSRVAYSKITKPGRPVSYGSLWQAEAETRIVTVPCGYADGYFRRMTNRAQVIVNKKKYPQVGRICMDQFMVNVGADEAQVGDEVVLLGDGISAHDLAEWMGTNEYEVLTSIGARVPRVFVTD